MYFLCNFVHITHSDFVEILCSLAYTTHNVLCTFCVSLLTPPTAFWGVFRVGGLHHHQDFDDKDDDKDDKDDHDDDDDTKTTTTTKTMTNKTTTETTTKTTTSVTLM